MMTKVVQGSGFRNSRIPRVRVIAQFEGESLTRQSELESTDINLMIKGMQPFTEAQSTYVDETTLPSSYQEALNIVVSTRNVFDQLPSAVRSYFDNDPHLFVEAMQDSARDEEMRELGLKPPSELPDTPAKPHVKEAEPPSPSGGDKVTK